MSIMEKRQLDFNAPLLSARRFSSPRNSSELAPRKAAVEKRATPGAARKQPIHSDKPDWEPDDIIKPAAVPFHWERTPGRPKNEPKARLPTTTSPRLPPGWVHSGEIPRLPVPHRLSGSGPSKSTSGPVDQIIFTDHASIIKKLDESLNCKEEYWGTENEEDTYSDDSINTLSFNESCRVSGISGSHAPGIPPSGTFSVDKQTRDFMMSRFLPAAKAVVVLETPQYAAKKPEGGPTDKRAVVGPAKKKIVSGEMRRPLVRQYGSSELLTDSGKEDFDNGESEDEEDAGQRAGRVLVKKEGRSGGIISRICKKSSMCLLSSLPATKPKSRPTTPTAGGERRLRKSAASGPLDKDGNRLPLPPLPKHKHHSGLLSLDLRRADSSTTVKPTIGHHDSYPLLSSRDSPLRRYRSGSVSPIRTSRVGPVVPTETHTRIASSRKMFEALRDVSRSQSLGPTADAVEKTVHVDSGDKGVEKCSNIEGAGVKEGFKGSSCLQPPLPKSPSESWLWRTVPFGELRRSGEFRGKGSGGGDETKWESIVKGSKPEHDRARFSEELMPHASYKQSKS